MEGAFRSKRTHQYGGFTLIELIVTVTVLAVGLVLAVSGYTNVIASNRLAATTNELVESIKQAQIQAIKRNTSVQFCSNSSTNNGSSTLGTACGGSAGTVYWVDPGSGSAAQIQGQPQLPTTISIGDGTSSTTAVTALLFAGNGLATKVGASSGPYTGFVADIYSSSIKSNNHRCIYITTGSVVSSCTSNGACPSNEPATCQ